MSQPATAGIVLGCIFGGAAAIYMAFRLHYFLQRRRRRRSNSIEQELPPIRPPSAFYGSHSQRAGMMSYSPSQGTIYGGGMPGSRPVSAAWDLSELAGIDPKAASSPGLLTPAAASSTASGSPSHNAWDGSASGSASFLQPLPTAARSPTLTADGLEPLLSERPGSRMSIMSSTSSTMTLKRSYASSMYKGSAQSHSPHPSPSSPYGFGIAHPQQTKRHSYLPHSPLNRDSIQIVPPQPLGIGFGGLAQAVDQRTLAFSPASGIGDGSVDTFGQGLVWPASGKEEGEDSARPTRSPRTPSAAVWSSVGVDQRRRYLEEGPARQTSLSDSIARQDYARQTSSFSHTSAQSRDESPAVRSITQSMRSNVSGGLDKTASDGLHPGYPSSMRRGSASSEGGRSISSPLPPPTGSSAFGGSRPQVGFPRHPLDSDATPRVAQEHSSPVAVPASENYSLQRLLSGSSNHSSADAYSRNRQEEVQADHIQHASDRRSGEGTSIQLSPEEPPTGQPPVMLSSLNRLPAPETAQTPLSISTSVSYPPPTIPTSEVSSGITPSTAQSSSGAGSGNTSTTASRSGSGASASRGSGSTTTETAGSSTENLATLVEEPLGEHERDRGRRAGDPLFDDLGKKMVAGHAQQRGSDADRPSAEVSTRKVEATSPALKPLENTSGELVWTY